MNLLVLTDHVRHSDSNSLYALLHALLQDGRVSAIRLLSRSLPLHRPIFEDPALTAAKALSIGAQDDRLSVAARLEDEKDLTEIDIAWPDAVLMRIPPPIAEEHLLLLQDKFGHLPIINRPEGIWRSSSKAYLLEHSEWCVPIRHCQQPEELRSFVFPKGEHQPARNVVLKPRYGYGGKNLLRILDGRVDLPEGPIPLQNWLNDLETPLDYLAMEYLPRVAEGDKRIVVAGGEIIGAVMRYPGPGQWLCNISQGGKAGLAQLSDHERKMIEHIHPALEALGVHFYGVDTLLDSDGRRVLSELNTMSVGGLLDLPSVKGEPAVRVVARRLVDIFVNNLASREMPS